MTGWEKLKPIEGSPGPCLCCGGTHEVLPMEATIAVGFGSSGLTKNGLSIYDESQVVDDKYMTVAEAEELAAKDPDNDWRIFYFGPLSEKHYQRQGDKHWILYEKGMGFA